MDKKQEIRLVMKRNMSIGDSISYKSMVYTKTRKKKLNKTIEEIKKFFSQLVQIKVLRTKTSITLLF